MDGRDWGNFLLPYAQAVEELKVKFKTLRTELKKREEYSPIEFVTGRVKRISSILEKSKRIKVPIDQLEQGIEDITGIRIMCQFVDDIHRVADLIRNRQDMRVIYEKDYITNYKESGYRSFHVIVEYPVQTALGQKIILAEIQIRTLAMNFWATIEHSLNYKYKDSLPEEVRQRLKTAAEAAFVLDNEMSSIRQEILVAQQSFEDRSRIVQNCLSFIQELYSYHRIFKAIQFQNRFNKVWAQNDMMELKRLEEEIKKELESAKKNGDVQL